MKNVNHKGITVRSSSYPEDWNPSSIQSYNNFMAHVVLQNLKNEGVTKGLGKIEITIRACKPIPIGEIIRRLLNQTDEFQMNNVINQANQIINPNEHD
ncbi:hypothetical protein [Sphingobacterium cellulitidis]|uniref:hypothetical protein n=1 Tax=Sphingobacterium cellulitidis TaxID=1768011 RepID=UPI000B94634A|nr:hypothetical protein CHT99_15455 [Sphingobacterium cellulitidis]